MDEKTIEIKINPLLMKGRIPGQTFTLPSQGLFYKKGELHERVKNGEIYICPMTTLDEITFQTPDKLFSGEAISDVFSRCISDVKEPMKLLAKDVDFILICLRKISYGNNMTISYKHTCENAMDHKYDIPMDPFIHQSKRIDPVSIDSVFSFTLDNGQVIKISPPRFENVIKIYQLASKANDDNTEDGFKDEFIGSLVGMIESVDDIEDKEMIKEWVTVVPAGFIKRITSEVEKLGNWGPNFDVTLKCKDCGQDFVTNTPVNPLAFFI